MNENPTNKFIVLVHGVSICYVGSLKYFDIFYRNGFNVLIVNQRRHGKVKENIPHMVFTKI